MQSRRREQPQLPLEDPLCGDALKVLRTLEVGGPVELGSFSQLHGSDIVDLLLANGYARVDGDLIHVTPAGISRVRHGPSRHAAA